MKKAKAKTSPKKAPVPKTALKASAKAVKELPKKAGGKAAEKKTKSVNVAAEEVSTGKPKRGASKSLPKKPAVVKTVKPPKPKMSPVKSVKSKAAKIPKAATPTKAPKSKKAVGSKSQKTVPNQPEELSGNHSEEEAVPVPAEKSRKRAKPVKEVVTVKKPRGITYQILPLK